MVSLFKAEYLVLTHTHTQSDIPFGKNIRSHAGFQAVIAFLSDVLEIRVGNPCGIYGAYPLDRFIAVAVKYRSIQIELINEFIITGLKDRKSTRLNSSH